MSDTHELIRVPAEGIIGVLEQSFERGQLSTLAEDALEVVLSNGGEYHARGEDPDGLADAVVEEVLNDPTLRMHLEHAARQLVRDLMSTG